MIETKKFKISESNSVLYIDYNLSDKSISLSYFLDDYLDSKNDFESIDQLLSYLREVRLDNALNWKLKDYIKDILPYLHCLKKDAI